MIQHSAEDRGGRVMAIRHCGNVARPITPCLRPAATNAKFWADKTAPRNYFERSRHEYVYYFGGGS